MSNLDKYLLEFEENAIKRGIKIHWAKDAQEHNEIVHKLLERKKMLKS